ncbi:MAG: phenylalanine--tRNA ligase subunit beta [Deltaproteobacteria bacterium]|nr:phenylalanine--tRNA ligase subunit beta [Deltaproteobacteria bacterium]
MKISYNWLKEYIKNLPPPYRLAEQLTMAGLEVEGIETLDKGIKAVVIAQIISVEKHPNADKLSFCKVKTDKDIHSIVCGAKNMKNGDKVALALPGAILPKGIKIEKAKIRGVESEGMMCSESELGLKDISEGIMILPQDIPIGKDFTEAMGLNDVVLNVNVTPNRPDCLSIFGIAREVAAITGGKGENKFTIYDLRIKNLKIENRKSKIENLISVSIAEPALCRRYAARVVENIKVGHSPDWLKWRLETAGFRSINNVVDITNYVMIEYGQPLHAFDYDLVSGKRIIVRRANQGEKIQTLDGVERVLTKEMLVICDAKKPIALAGIMGGKESEIHDATRNILLESAYFNPSCVRTTSKALGISTESSYRFERGADIDGVTRALDKAVQMIKELAGGDIVSGAIDEYPRPYEPVSINIRLSRINKLLGINIKAKEVEDCLSRLRISFKTVRRPKVDDSKIWNVAPPSCRVDILNEIDIIEEIARVYGYENIPATMPTSELAAVKASHVDFIREKVRGILANNGFLEAINYSFVSPQFFDITSSNIEGGLKLLNPLTEEQSVMRQSLISGLLQTLIYNLNHNNRDIKIFEIGRIFIPHGQKTEERELISGLISGFRYGEAWNIGREAVDFYDVKGAVEQVFTGFGITGYAVIPKTDIPFLHPGKGGIVEINNKEVGIIGEVHPDTMQELDIKQSAYIFELDMHSMSMFLSGQNKYTPIPKYPMIIRDAAMIINREIPFQELYNAVKRLEIKLLEEVKVFDVYYGENIQEGKCSIAMRFMYRSPDKTLADDEVNNIHANILKNLKDKFGAEIRGE